MSVLLPSLLDVERMTREMACAIRFYSRKVVAEHFCRRCANHIAGPDCFGCIKVSYGGDMELLIQAQCYRRDAA